MLKSELEEENLKLKEKLSQIRSDVTEFCGKVREECCDQALPYINEICKITGSEEPTQTIIITLTVNVPISFEPGYTDKFTIIHENSNLKFEGTDIEIDI